MFYKNQSNNNSPSINTRLAQFYSQENAVNLSAWNNNISLRIQPFIGTDSNGIRQYENSKDKCIFTSITPDNAVVLANAIENKIYPAIEAGTAKSVSIMIGANTNARKILTVGFDGKDSYMQIALNVSETGVTDEKSIVIHTFSTRDYLEDYTYTDGSGIESLVHSDLIRFTNKLKEVDYLGASISHGIKYAEASRASYGNGISDSKFNNTETVNHTQNQYSAPVQNFDGADMGDLLPFD